MEHYQLAVKPEHTCIPIAEVAKLYSLPDLEVQVKRFLHGAIQSLSNNPNLPNEWHLLDVWKSVKILEPEVVSTDDSAHGMQNILAHLRTRNSDIPCFQTILVDQALESGQDRDIGLTGMLS